MPEFLIIAVVALVVLGPERLPEVMRKVGRFYRQARELATQYTSEAQKMFDEGMREVEDVSSTIGDAWQEATTETAGSTPPKLYQVPPPREAPETAPAAGPWVLPAWYRDTRADLEPQPSSYPEGPVVLPRKAAPAEDYVYDFDSFAGAGGPSLMGPVFGEPELAEPDLTISIPEIAAPTHPERSDGEAAAHASRTAPATTAPSNGAYRLDPGERALSEREHTVIDLYRSGGVTLEKAAEFLNLTPAELWQLADRC